MLASGQEEIQKDYKALRNFYLNYLQIKKLKIEDYIYLFSYNYKNEDGTSNYILFLFEIHLTEAKCLTLQQEWLDLELNCNSHGLRS